MELFDEDDGSQEELESSIESEEDDDPIFHLGDEDEDEGEDEVEDDSEEPSNSDEAPSPTEEELRRQEQSFKDKYYNLLEKEQQQPQQQQQVATQTDPIIAELSPYIQQLNALVTEGDITEDDAKLRLQEQYYVRKMTYDLEQKYNQSYEQSKGSENLQSLRGEFAKFGIDKGSAEEKEAIGLLKNHWGLDVNNPNAFAAFKSSDDISKLAMYVSAATKLNSQKREGTSKPAPKSNKGTRSSSVAPKKGGAGYTSLSEVSAAARRGELK